MRRRTAVRLLGLPLFAAAAATLALGGCASTPAPEPLDSIVIKKVPAGYDGVVLVRPARGGLQAVTARGQARIEQPLGHDTDTRFLIGSISKWITTVAVLRLVDQGRIGLDQPVTAYLPELPRESSVVTVRHLLSNTSGIPNGLARALQQDRATVERLQITPLEGALRFGAGAPGFQPGTAFDYSFTNWLLVGGIVERVTGEPFQQAIARLVLQPSGVRDTGFADDAWERMPRAALAYDQGKTKRKMSAMPPMVAASGTMYSTAADLVAIADAVYAGTLLSPRSRTELLTVQHAPEDYALGGRVRNIGSGKRTAVWNAGAIGGFKTLLVYAPDDGAAAVLLNNTDMAQSAQADIATALLDAVLQSR